MLTFIENFYEEINTISYNRMVQTNEFNKNSKLQCFQYSI